MQRHNKIIIVGLVVLGLVVFFLTRKDEITNFPPKGTNVVAFGDSLVEGVGATKGNDFVSLISRNTGLNITNLGKAGDTTRDGLRRLTEALALKPDTVMLLLGGNDALRKIPIEETEANLKSIIREFQNNGAVVLLLGVRGGLFTDPYDSMYKRLSKTTGTAYVGDVLDGLFGNSKYMSDAIHPNDAGYEIIALRVGGVLIDIYK